MRIEAQKQKPRKIKPDKNVSPQMHLSILVQKCNHYVSKSITKYLVFRGVLMFDEELFKSNPKPIDLEALSISELNERILALKAEIVRCEQAINKKSSGLDAANALFSKP